MQVSVKLIGGPLDGKRIVWRRDILRYQESVYRTVYGKRPCRMPVAMKYIGESGVIERVETGT